MLQVIPRSIFGRELNPGTAWVLRSSCCYFVQLHQVIATSPQGSEAITGDSPMSQFCAQLHQKGKLAFHLEQGKLDPAASKAC